MVTVVTIETPSLGDRSYLAHDGRSAVVVDPQRDIDRVLEVARTCGVEITHVFETHLHNDYLTGGLALADLTGADYHVNGADEVGFDRVPIGDGDVVDVSPSMRLRALATPGHTFTHLSYVLEENRVPVAAFTGGSLLFGSAGRPDLFGPDHAERLAYHQHASVQRLARDLPDDVDVLPTHGFGSFCSSTQTSATSSTIGAERLTNPALSTPAPAWVGELLAGLDDWPSYYVRMGRANAAGPSSSDLRPPVQIDPEHVHQALRRGQWLIDVRDRADFATKHVQGSYNFGLDGQFATYVGWLVPWGTSLTLMGRTSEQLALAQRELSRIGIDRPPVAVGAPRDWTDGALGSFPRATFADLAQAQCHRDVAVLDVRRAPEWEAGHLPGSTNIAIHELMDRLDEVPSGEVWVHCASGYRASVAASILAAAEVSVVAVDDDYVRSVAHDGVVAS